MKTAEVQEKLYLVVERLKNLQRPENEDSIAQAMPDGGKSVGLYRRDFGMEPWDWPQGVGLYGMYNLFKLNGDSNIRDYIVKWYQNHIEKGLPVRNINTSAPMLTLSYIMGELGEEYKDAAKEWADWIINELPKTPENGFQHTTTDNAELGTINLNQDEVWIDTLFMAVMFLARMGEVTGELHYQNEALHQVLFHIKYLYEKRNGLFYHGYTFKENNNFGGIFWCRGNSWFTSACVDLIEIMGDKLDDGVKSFLIDTYKAQVKTLRKYQSEGGLWHTVIDDNTSYTEVSGSAGMAYGILKGIRLGILEPEYMDCALKAIGAIMQNVDEGGTVQNVSAGTGMGFDKDHYRNIIIAPMAYGQSLVIMALTEALKCGALTD